MGIALTLIVLMVITASLSMISAVRIGYRLDDINQKYIPAYGALARTNLRSVERALELRRILIAKMQGAGQDDVAAIRKIFDEKGSEVEREAAAAAIDALLRDDGAAENVLSLTRLQDRLQAAMSDSRRYLNAEIEHLLRAIDTGNKDEINDGLARVDSLRNELNSRLDSVRADMLVVLRSESDIAARKQYQATLIAALTTALAAILGFVFSALVSDGVTRPVRRLLEGARAVEAGRLDETIAVSSEDEIGHLTVAFNRMVEQLRLKQRIYETFGKYIDPRVVEGLIEPQALASEGQRRTMTILFCDIKGFSSNSEDLSPQGLVKVVNRYLTIMSEPIHAQSGIIDKYIGDGIMAYWGPPFNEEGQHARLASFAALDMIGRIGALNDDLLEQLDVRRLPVPLDMRIGIATGKVVVGSIGSELMMNYTVIGDTVNLASRLEGANKVYGCRILVSEETVKSAGDAIEVREIDRIVVAGQTRAETVFEVLGRKGTLNSAQIEFRTLFAEGLSAYRHRQWDAALRSFKSAMAIERNDGASRTFIERIQGFLTHPPAEGWDGSWKLENK